MSVVSLKWRDGDNRRLVYFDTASWLIDTLDIYDVPWMRQGLAEVASGYDVMDGEHIWGAPVYVHIRPMRALKPLSTKRLVAVTASDAQKAEYSAPYAAVVCNMASMGRFYTERDIPQQFQPTSWLLVHYLLYGRHDIPRNALNTYLQEVIDGTEAAVAFQRAFLTDFKTMDEELRYYVKHKSFEFYRAKPPPIPTLIAHPAAPQVVFAALARAALVAGNLPLAGAHITLLQELAPQSPEAEELLGYLAKRAGTAPS